MLFILPSEISKAIVKDGGPPLHFVSLCFISHGKCVMKNDKVRIVSWTKSIPRKRRGRSRRMRKVLTVLGYIFCVAGFVLSGSEPGYFGDFNVKKLDREIEKESLLSFLENHAAAATSSSPNPLMVPLTLIQGAASKAAGLSLSLSVFYILSWNAYIAYWLHSSSLYLHSSLQLAWRFFLSFLLFLNFSAYMWVVIADSNFFLNHGSYFFINVHWGQH